LVFELPALVRELSYAGVLLISLLGSSVPFLPAPYLVPVVIAVTELGLNPYAVVILSAVGATVGKLVIFVGSRAGRRLLSEETKTRMEPLKHFLLRYGWLAVLIAAATPLPDDVVFIPVAIGGFGLLRFFAFVFMGKIFITAMLVYSAAYARMWFKLLVSESFLGFAIAASLFYLVVALSVSYMFTKIDWRRFLQQRSGSKNN
jgi:membrane protein DedA with SNARE-associated domain